MPKWRTETRLYEITEINRKGKEVYHMLATGDEVSAWCKAKNEMNGYVPGLGGDRSYACIAIQMVG